MRLLATIVIVLFSIQSLAERWVVKDIAPQSLSPNIKIIKVIPLGDVTYTVLEIPTTLSFGSQQPIIGGADIFRDLPISLPTNIANPSLAAGKGWHTENLKYDNLPELEVKKEIIVAVLDTGVDYNHSALSANMWSNEDEIAGNGLDDDKNGYVDDVVGWDFHNKDADPIDDHSHGTHCAGVVAASKDVNSSSRGLAPMVKIMPIKIIGNNNGKGFLSDAADAIKYAVDNGADVLSNSWGLYRSWDQYYDAKKLVFLIDAIKYAEKNNVIFVAAAGNDSRDINNLNNDQIFPVGLVGHSNIVGVAAYDNSEKKSYFSNHGVQNIHVAAPGSGIHSTVKDNKWATYDGTSMATPIVAGLIARGLSYGMSYDEAMEALYQTSRSTPMNIKHGLIDPMSFLESIDID